MQTIQPDQADFLLHGVYLPSLRNEHGLTRSVIEAIPLEQGGYRPDEVSKSALDLAWHIAATEIRFMEAVAAGAFDFSPRPLPDSIKNSKDLAAWYSENFEPRFETLTKLSNEQLTKVVDFRGLFQLPAVTYLNFVLHHSIHHRGQLSTYSAADGRESRRQSTAKATTPPPPAKPHNSRKTGTGSNFAAVAKFGACTWFALLRDRTCVLNATGYRLGFASPDALSEVNPCSSAAACRLTSLMAADSPQFPLYNLR